METHDYRIDRLRLLACFGVVMLHSSAGSGADDLALNAIFRFSVIASQTSCNQQLLSFIAPNVVLSGGACFAFYMTRRPLPERFNPILRRASGCTMGVYLLHLMVSDLLTPHLRPVMEPLLPAGAMAVRCVCVFAVTFSVVWLLRYIRPVRKFAL